MGVKTCVVMGNGKSLLTMPRDLLDKYDSFGVNYIGLSGIQPTYFVCIDYTVLTQHADMIYETAKNAKKAFLNKVQPEPEKLYKLSNVVFVDKDAGAFSQCVYMSGYTAVYVALKMAYYEGYQEVHLYGVDHDREWEHFTDNYPSGVKTDEIRMDVMLWHYRYANEVFKKDGRKIYNFSNPSYLDRIFERKC